MLSRVSGCVCLFYVGNGVGVLVEDPHSENTGNRGKNKEMAIQFCGEASKTVSAYQT